MTRIQSLALAVFFAFVACVFASLDGALADSVMRGFWTLAAAFSSVTMYMWLSKLQVGVLFAPARV
jgi:hypothetical protein